MHRASWLQESKYYIAQTVRPNYRDVLRVMSLARDEYHVQSADVRLQLLQHVNLLQKRPFQSSNIEVVSQSRPESKQFFADTRAIYRKTNEDVLVAIAFY